MAIPLVFKNTPDLEFTEGAKNVAGTAAGWALLELLEHYEDQKRLTDK